MTINVMGATGQLGRRVMQALIDQGASPGDLVASVRSPDKARGLAAQGISVRLADYDDQAMMVRAFDETEVLLLIPSTARVEPRIMQHYNALKAAWTSGVKRVVFCSLSSAAFPNSRFFVTPYLLYAELKLRQSRMGWTILRNGMYLDPVADWMPELVEMGRLPYPVRGGTVAYIARHDLARATAAACLNDQHAGKVYELTGSEALSMDALAGAISEATGHQIPFHEITENEYAEICRSGKDYIPEALIPLLISLYHAVDHDEFAHVTDHVEQLTGTPPERAGDYLRRIWTQKA